MADSTKDTQIRAELAQFLGPHISEAIGRLENAHSQVDADLAMADMKQYSRWLDWLKTAQTGGTQA
jgi:hypothetical protein